MLGGATEQWRCPRQWPSANDDWYRPSHLIVSFHGCINHLQEVIWNDDHCSLSQIEVKQRNVLQTVQNTRFIPLMRHIYWCRNYLWLYYAKTGSVLLRCAVGLWIISSKGKASSSLRALELEMCSTTSWEGSVMFSCEDQEGLGRLYPAALET